MKTPLEWKPSALKLSPLFMPLHPVIARLGGGTFPVMSDFNDLLEGAIEGVSVQQGHGLRFVAQESGSLRFEAQYEPRCYLTGEVQTRENNWHDLFNALVWLTFPKAKAAINARHYQALSQKINVDGSQRGRVRDMATLLDESGVIVVCADPKLAELLTTFQWKELFWHQRDQIGSSMGFFIFGHGLYEKALTPYVGMTGQGLMLPVSEDFFNWTLTKQLNHLDVCVAAYLDHPDHCLNPRELNPVPLLGVPGWSEENEHLAYYENTSYFRPGRRELK